ncbi:MAG TPA: MscL family protein [Nitrososphaera sp.]|jgi:large conductance mechanosensitive channel
MADNPPPTVEKKNIIHGFVDFLKTFGVIGLAIAFVIGAASSSLVTSLVQDIVNPLIGLFLPSGNLEQMHVNATGVSDTPSQFRYGHLISETIDFLIIAFIVFLAYKWLSRYKLVEDKTRPK